MSDRIEAVLAVHRIPARVTGGTVTPRWVRFQVVPAVGAKISEIRELHEELSTALDVPNVRVSRRGAAVALEIPRQDPQPVRLLPLYRQLNKDVRASGSIPAMTAVLGLAEDGAPLLIRLPSPDVAHILVAGTTGAGKTTLLRALALSLAMTNSPYTHVAVDSGSDGGLMFTLIDTQGDAFDCFAALPHLTRPVVRNPQEATEVLSSLVRLMEVRRNTGDYRPTPSRMIDQTHVVVMIKELADLLLEGGQAISESLVQLTQRGQEVGIHVVAATSRPTPAVMEPLVKASFPVRLIGRVASAEEARIASGWSGTGAEAKFRNSQLVGHGDFLAVAEGRVLRFQAAHISEDEVHEVAAYIAQAVSITGETLPFARQAAALPWPVNRLAVVFKGA